MQENVEKDNGTTADAQKRAEKVRKDFSSTDARAQYEVFRNGALPRETIKEWIENDLKAIMSFVSGVLTDPDLNEAVVDAYYKKYQKLHAKDASEEQKS